MKGTVLILLLLATIPSLPACIIVPRGETHHYYYGPPPYSEGPYYYNPKDGRYYRYEEGRRGEERTAPKEQ